MEDVKRWSVTYTKHIKQKRKVYQDGFLELHSSKNKVKLYDDCENLLDSRFLKKDDVLRTGETLAIDSYLVDIGDALGDHKPIPTSNLQGKDKKITENTRSLHGEKSANDSISVDKDRTTRPTKNKAPSSNLSPSQKIIREFKKSEMKKYGASPDSPNAAKTRITEWDAMYTNQVTQKTKKYHSGTLRVEFCGPNRVKVTLLTEDGTLLSHRHLKLSEEVKSGITFELPNYLVEVGEPRRHSKGEPQKNATSWKDMNSNITRYSFQNVKSKNRVHSIKPLRDEKHQNNNYALEDVDSGVRSFYVDDVKLTNITIDKPLRDAHEILSVLRKPTNKESVLLMERTSMKESHASHSSDFLHSDVQSQVLGQSGQYLCGERNAVDVFEEETVTTQRKNGDVLTSKAVENNILIEAIKSADPDNGGESESIISASSCFSFGSGVSDISTPLNVECTGSVGITPGCTTREPQVLGKHVLKCGSDYQQPTESVAHDRSARNVKIRDSPELMSSEATSDCSPNQLYKEEVLGCFTQHFADNKRAGAKQHEVDSNHGLATSNECTHDPWSVGSKIFEEHANTGEMDEFPTFDLGF